ncbi:MAG: protein-L-isoaspartate(D-aspartate) O-methyltransferase [Alphaproteobacteria bacterium]|jgi:protein-L-isoaspartate(D-aspartate) O-methyltransferase|nr:protein-L-isoaspartate(D-aspartate) O-methyltransferase [Alphaproteobacteria bacterium]
MSEDGFARERRRMVESQLRARGIRDERVLEAMATVPRERFVDEGSRPAAYDDGPLPIGRDQTISQPYVVALMLELAAPGPDDRVLEVGAGCGYVVAVLAQLAREVVGIERHPDLARRARDQLAALGLANARVVAGDGTRGLAEAAPFDAVVVSAGAAAIPPALQDQLAVGGRLVVPEGAPGLQELRRVVRTADGGFTTTTHGAVAFVPLVGDDAHGGRA